MSSSPLPTPERLARAIEAAASARGDTRPQLLLLIERARLGYYDDFRSALDFPTTQLIIDLHRLGYGDLAQRAEAGEFDASMSEAEAWMEREGKYLISLEAR